MKYPSNLFFIKFPFLGLLAMMLFLSSCNQDQVFKKYLPLLDKQWPRNKVLKFEVNITDTSGIHQLVTAFRYVSYIKHKAIKIQLTSSSPSGKNDIEVIEIPIKDENGKHLGEAIGDVADIKKTVRENLKFGEKGIYSFEFKQMMVPEDVGGIMEVGLIISKAK